MHTQNTPVHVKLWHKEFWLLAIANMLITMSAYSMIPTMPMWLLKDCRFSMETTGLIMGCYGLGLFLLGGFCSYLVQKYRRNKVCILSVMGTIVVYLAFFYINDSRIINNAIVFSVLRIILGSVYSLAMIVLSSTLIIDTCESFQRTEANFAFSWFSRFALALGPIMGLTAHHYGSHHLVLSCTIIASIIAMILIAMVRFPFRTPEENQRLLSTDRFFLIQGLPLFINLLVIGIITGLVFSLVHNLHFYVMLMLGFLIALVAQKFVFVNADLKSEILTGLLFLGIAFILLLAKEDKVVGSISTSFIGIGISMIASRFLLFFIKLSRHCQRGTSQSTHFLSWELGIAIGITLGYTALSRNIYLIQATCLGLTILAFFIYNFFTHNWYMKHKNR